MTRDECLCSETFFGPPLKVATSVRSPGRWLRLGPGRLTNTMSPMSNMKGPFNATG